VSRAGIASRIASFVTAFAALVGVQLAWALDPSLDISQHGHRAWRNVDGLGLGTIVAMAQTADGYMWLATPTNLLRFDGVRSISMPPPDAQLSEHTVQALLGGRDGTLWIGTTNGLTSYKNGVWGAIPKLDGKTINTIFEDGDGAIWAGGSSKGNGLVCTVRGQLGECRGEDGRFGKEVVALHRDQAGSLWITGVEHVWKWGEEPTVSYALPGRMTALRAVARMQDGAFVFGLKGQVARLGEGKFEPLALPALDKEHTFVKVLQDRDGGLWLGASDAGLFHLHDGQLSRYTAADGLSGNHILDMFEDREGTIWVSTSRGLDQFRPITAASHSTNTNGLEGRSRAILSASDGSMWAGTTVGVFQRGANGNWSARRAGLGTVLEDRHGKVWMTSLSGIGRFENGNYVPARGVPPGPVDAMVEDSKGGLWFAHREQGLLRLQDDGRLERTPWQQLGIAGRVGTMAVSAADGSLWLGLFSGALVNVVDGQARVRYAINETSAPIFRRIGQIRAERDGTLWVATPLGLNHIRQGRISRLDARSGLPCQRVVWSLFDAHFVWLATDCGIVQIDRPEIDAWVAAQDQKREAKVKVRLLDHWDGVPPAATPSALGNLFVSYVISPKMTRSQDGNIWAVTGDEVVSINPSRMPINSVPPPVHVEQLVSDGERYGRPQRLSLPPLQRDLRIEYTGLSYTAPERVQFRYKLEGRDADWEEAGQRREAFYTDLAPGSYRFRVVAANANGVWNREGDTIEFTIEPAWWQTIAFRLACIAAAALLLYGAYRWRIKQLSRRFGVSLEARVDERMRIARELHDTLLQTFQGLVLRLQTAHQLWPSSDGRRILAEGIDQAADAVTEGRDAVQGLRAAASEGSDLAEAIRSLGQVLAADPASPAARIGVEVQGRPRSLHPVVRDDVFRIVGEALRNAFRHAQPTQIEVEIRYDERELCVRVRDDGRGMDQAVARRGREGHFGLHGMRERAKLIGGKLTFWTRLGAGTAVELSVPASRAYAAAAEARHPLRTGTSNDPPAHTIDT
jgi:signal transduction histidine kinase/ligand-binding sensor domain-containing protein